MDFKKSNKLIAEFMEEDRHRNFCEAYCPCPKDDACIVDFNLLMYDKSWDWLIPVVEKIENLYPNEFIFMIKSNNVYTQSFSFGKKLPDYHCSVKDSIIEAVYNIVVEFIKWYNKEVK